LGQIVCRNVAAGAEHFRQGTRRVYLRRIKREELAFFRLASRFFSHAKEIGIEVHVNPALVCPNGIAGVIVAIGLVNNPEHTSEAINHKVPQQWPGQTCLYGIMNSGYCHYFLIGPGR
jgi:hypothetical protein